MLRTANLSSIYLSLPNLLYKIETILCLHDSCWKGGRTLWDFFICLYIIGDILWCSHGVSFTYQYCFVIQFCIFYHLSQASRGNKLKIYTLEPRHFSELEPPAATDPSSPQQKHIFDNSRAIKEDKEGDETDDDEDNV